MVILGSCSKVIFHNALKNSFVFFSQLCNPQITELLDFDPAIKFVYGLTIAQPKPIFCKMWTDNTTEFDIMVPIPCSIDR